MPLSLLIHPYPVVCCILYILHYIGLWVSIIKDTCTRSYYRDNLIEDFYYRPVSIHMNFILIELKMAYSDSGTIDLEAK